QVESSRTRGLVLAALAALPDRHRQAIVLHDLEGLPPHQIARAMGVPMSTAYSRLRRAHLAFARELIRAGKRPDAGPASSAGRRAFAAGVSTAVLALAAFLARLHVASLTL